MSRALSPLIGVTVLVGITVILGATVGVFALGIHPSLAPQTPFVVSLSATTETNQVVFVHEGGRPVDIRTLSITLTINDIPLDHQPPIPFFAAEGFRSGPTGPFNQAATPIWNPGEQASFNLASTNAPPLTRNAELTATLAINGTPVLTTQCRVT